jgi:hypothetical protein
VGEPGSPPAEGGVADNISAEAEGHFVEGLYIGADLGDGEGQSFACGVAAKDGLAECRFVAEEVDAVTCGYAGQGCHIVLAEVELMLWEGAIVA